MSNEVKKKESIIEKNVGSILSSLTIAFVLGTFAMIYKSDKTAQVFSTKLSYIGTAMNDLKVHITKLETKMEVNTKDRWTRRDHRDYEIRMDNSVNKLENRLIELERAQFMNSNREVKPKRR